MTSNFEICRYGHCGIAIIDNHYTDYIPEESSIMLPREFKFLETITLNVLINIYIDKENKPAFKILWHEFKEHSEDSFDQSYVIDLEDGLYRVIHFILPLEKIVSQEFKEQYSNVYYYCDDGNIRDTAYEIVSIEKLLEINPECEDEQGKCTSIVRRDKETFNMCKLEECFYHICRNTLSNFCGRCINKLKNSQQDIFNRDLIWMSINVIKYLLSFEQYLEALRVYNTITSCGNICHNYIKEESNGCGC